MERLPYVWDYDLDEEQFRRLLDGKLMLGRLDADWAAVRLLGFPRLVQGWQRWRSQIRSHSRRRGLDWFTEWLPEHHPEVL